MNGSQVTNGLILIGGPTLYQKFLYNKVSHVYHPAVCCESTLRKWCNFIWPEINYCVVSCVSLYARKKQIFDTNLYQTQPNKLSLSQSHTNVLYKHVKKLPYKVFVLHLNFILALIAINYVSQVSQIKERWHF